MRISPCSRQATAASAAPGARGKEGVPPSPWILHEANYYYYYHYYYYYYHHASVRNKPADNRRQTYS